MAWDKMPRTHCFSLGDFHDFEFCPFGFFVKHHLQKKYELAEGNENQAIGTLLDLTIKKLHQNKAYNQPVDYLVNLVKAAAADVKSDVAQTGRSSFYGVQLPFLTAEVILKAQKIFKNYHQTIEGKYQPLVLTPTLKRIKPFWKHVISSGPKPLQLWGGPDVIELGIDGVPEIIDYKYRDKESQVNTDMDLMPKVYTLLCAKELLEMSFNKARFKVKFWLDPLNEEFYEEFDLANMLNLELFLKDKIERILRTTELNFCNKEHCKVCKSDQKEQWVAQLKSKGFIGSDPVSASSSDLPF